MLRDFQHKIQRKWMKMRLQPIRVFCFHQVSDRFEESYMERIDWLSADVFKQRIEALRQEGYKFISLPEAYEKLSHDWFRIKKYVVLTADDGWATLKNVLPWLNEQQIPVTLFLNPAYLDGKHYRNSEKEEYLTQAEVRNLHKQYPLVTIGSHGWEHKDAMRQTEDEFRDSVERSEAYLKEMPNFVPFFAYAWGHDTDMTNRVLYEREIIPVLIQGEKNYTYSFYIDRELLV